MQIDKLFATINAPKTTEDASDRRVFHIVADLTGRVVELRWYASFPNIRQTMELKQMYPGAVVLTTYPGEHLTVGELWRAIHYAVVSASGSSSAEVACLPMILACVVEETKTGAHWVATLDFYHEYSGVSGSGRPAAAPAMLGIYPPPNSYAQFPVVGIWQIPLIVGDLINTEPGGFKGFSRRKDAEEWLSQHGGRYVGNE
jgi:hypothetical protein